jgi:hypothetical protein
MSTLRKIFGPSKREVWKQLSDQIGAEFVQRGFSEKVRVHVKEWVITLDTYIVSTGKSTVSFTRMRAPYVNADNFRFTVYRKGFFTELGKLVGMQDLEVGIPKFDEDFVIRAMIKQSCALSSGIRKSGG